MKEKKNYFKKINLCLILSLVLSFTFFIILYINDVPKKILLPQGSIQDISNYSGGVVEREIEILLEPSYFFSVAEVKVAADSSNPNIKANASIDKESWSIVNISKKPNRDNETLYASVGEVPINQRFKIFTKTWKTSNFSTGSNLHYDVVIKIHKFNLSGKRWVLIVLVFAALLGTIFTILNAYRDLLYNSYKKFRKVKAFPS